MKTSSVASALLLTLMVLLGTEFGACEKKSGTSAPTPVQVGYLESHTLRSEITLLGDVEAFTLGDVHTEVAGLVDNFLVKEGDYVREGQILAELNSSQLMLELEGTKSEREEARVLYEKEQQEYERYKILTKSQSISTQEFEKELAEAHSTKFRLQRLENHIKLMEDRLSKKIVRAPFDGFVVEEYVHRGMWVQVGGRIVRMAQVDPIYITVPMPQKYLTEIIIGDEANVRLDRVTNETLRGKVAAVIRSGDTASRTFPVKIKLSNDTNSLAPGMLAYVTLKAGQKRRTLTVPKDAVVITADQRRLVYLVEENRATPVPIETGVASGGRIEVKGDGLKEGQMVVTVGNERLRPGQLLAIIGPLKKL